MRRSNSTGIRRKRVRCPECGAVRIITWRAGVRRFQAKPYRCREEDCDFVGRRGAWDDPLEIHR